MQINQQINLKCKSGCKDQESIQSSTTLDPGYHWKSDKHTVKHHKREPRGQPFPSRWPQGTYINDAHKDTANTRQKNHNIHKSSTALKQSVKYFIGGLKTFSQHQPRPYSVVDQNIFGKVTKNTTNTTAKRPAPPSRRPQGYKEQIRQHNTHQHEALSTKTLHKRGTLLEQSVKILSLEGLNPFHGTNLDLS